MLVSLRLPFKSRSQRLLVFQVVLTQLAIVLGIMITQAIGLRLASPTEWRIVFFVSFVLSAMQVLFSVFVVESPSWLGANGRLDEKKAVAHKLWGSSDRNHLTNTDLVLHSNVLQVPAQEVKMIHYSMSLKQEKTAPSTLLQCHSY